MSASLGFVPAAHAEELDYPSWNDVEKAKQSEAATADEIGRIRGILDDLRTSADAASVVSQQAAEEYRVTADELDVAKERASTLSSQATDASEKAEVSRMRAGLLAAHLARAGDNDLSLTLFLSGDEAASLLSKLGSASKLGEQSQLIYAEALQDRNAAASLTEQATAAATERERLSAAARDTYDAAEVAADTALTALNVEQKRSDDLYAQLALLKNTTADVERAYVEGERAREAQEAQEALQAAQAAADAEAAFAAAARSAVRPGTAAPVGDAATRGENSSPAARPAPVKPAPSKPAPSKPGPSKPAPSKPAPSKPAPSKPAPSKPAPSKAAPAKPAPSRPAPSKPAPSKPAPAKPAPSRPAPPKPAPVTPAPAPPAPQPSAPNSSAVETAISFARSHLGDRYQLGGSGPHVWDCSGLTRAAYGASGIWIGTHSATNQYYTMANQGKAVSVGNAQRGDLLFWGGGGDYYHVAIYLGGGMVLEAADVGKPVREHYIWGSPSAAVRPTG